MSPYGDSCLSVSLKVTAIHSGSTVKSSEHGENPEQTSEREKLFFCAFVKEAKYQRGVTWSKKLKCL